MTYSNKMRDDMKSRYPVNQLQMSYTTTTEHSGEHRPVGYGEGFSDPHQGGFMGEMSSNMDVKKPKKRVRRSLGHGFGY